MGEGGCSLIRVCSLIRSNTVYTVYNLFIHANIKIFVLFVHKLYSIIVTKMPIHFLVYSYNVCTSW